MARTMEEMTGVKAYVEREVERYAGECVAEISGGVMLKEEAYRQVPEELRNYVLQLVLCRRAGRKKDLQAVHIEALAELFDRQTGRMLYLPYGMTARRCYEGIRLTSSNGSAEAEENHCAEEEEPGKLYRMRVFEYHPEEETFPEKVYTKWFDYDIINNTVEIRHLSLIHI